MAPYEASAATEEYDAGGIGVDAQRTGELTIADGMKRRCDVAVVKVEGRGAK